MAENSRKIAGDCVRIATSIIDPTIVGWNCKPLNRRAARTGGSCVNPCCFMKFITAERDMCASSYVLFTQSITSIARCHFPRSRARTLCPHAPSVLKQVLRSRAFRALAQDDTPPRALKKEQDGTP